ncbi:hypothetical protein SCHPADRAFT_150285 [Schizopora paradoxa]|uniref:Uncharacterized protein n=1 Tax=Schizopora paradoxa TaxID=27342 RepID=A0A0H2S187_9AGAM|nr:hypothetical protein SCHPADRAFT_150285 [Schizopora paradoxa]
MYKSFTPSPNLPPTCFKFGIHPRQNILTIQRILDVLLQRDAFYEVRISGSFFIDAQKLEVGASCANNRWKYVSFFQFLSALKSLLIWSCCLRNKSVTVRAIRREHMTGWCAKRRLVFVSDGQNIAVYSVYSTQAFSTGITVIDEAPNLTRVPPLL